MDWPSPYCSALFLQCLILFLILHSWSLVISSTKVTTELKSGLNSFKLKIVGSLDGKWFYIPKEKSLFIEHYLKICRLLPEWQPEQCFRVLDVRFLARMQMIIWSPILASFPLLYDRNQLGGGRVTHASSKTGCKWSQPTKYFFLNCCSWGILGQCNTHGGSVVCSLPHTWAHKLPRMANVTLNDGEGEYTIPPTLRSQLILLPRLQILKKQL